MTLSPATGTPDGDQLLDRFQFPLVGVDVLPDDPFQVLVVIISPPEFVTAIVVRGGKR
jgi:hypothetical protein